MTKTVTIAATRTNGDPYAHHDVIVTLVAGSAGGVVGSNVIVEQSTVKLDADGEGSIVLETNEAITSPSTSFYRFTVADSSPTITRSIRLTDDLPSSVSWTLADIQVGDPTIPQRDVSSDYVTIGGQSLTNYLADLKFCHADVAFHPVDTSGTYPASDIDPIADTAAWVTAGGPAFFGVSVGDVVAVNNDPCDPTTTGIYDWDGTTFTRHPDYVTTASLDKLLVVSHVHHSHFTGAPLATPIPLGVMFFADDADAALGTAEFTAKIFLDFESAIDLVAFLGGGGVALGETSTTAYRGDRGKTAYDHSQVVAGNPHGTTAADVGAAATSHTHAASAITTGTLDIARIPTGTTGSTVPFGNDARFSDTRTPTDASVTAAKLATSLASRIPTLVRATSDLTRTGTTKTDDPEITFAAAASTYYRVEFHLTISGDATADVSLGITIPSGATMSFFVDHFATSIASTTGTQQGAHITTSGSGGGISAGVIASPGVAYRITGWVLTSTTPGAVSLIWGQVNNGAATGVTRQAGSHLVYYTP